MQELKKPLFGALLRDFMDGLMHDYAHPYFS
jgi:hypothetical protein